MELKLLLALGLPIMPAAAETVLGIYVFHRHGDRTAKKTPPVRFTDLGAYEVYTSGLHYGERYVRDNATAQIRSISADDVRPEQLAVTSPSDVVLQSSAYAFLQGFYPPVGTADALANGSRVEAPLGGYQYVPVNSVGTAAAAATRADAESSEWLQGGSGCGRAVVSSNNYFSSPQYAALEAESRAFYRSLLPVINGTFDDEAASFANAYTIFDLVNVAIIHNESIPAADLLTDAAVRTLTDYANIHEWNLAFNESDPVRAIAGKVLAGQVLQGLNATLHGAAAPGAVKANIQFGAYAAFSSFFGLAQLDRVSEDFKAIVDYASSMVFELVTNATSASPAADEVSVRFRFANGSAGASPLTAYPLFGRAETVLPWDTFVDEMRRFAVEDTKSWCTACGNSTGTCAAALGLDGSADSNGSGSGSGGSGGISAPMAGVIGALVTLVVILGIQGLVMLGGGLRMVKKSNVVKDVPAASAIEEVAGRKH
ncbi:phosphoglycerate mutase-like protein [Colletotrichum sublineola]|uniref:Putative histidine acid phosphatase n=1 Tax=Colletotrichum sublineola TaxID=1173701 RepID=A0A066XB38_COLSU|nr:phosphoglycerate mutase-like protein [Colletotrichum sublineola]KDN64869.1 putative histidine acid phosphatase [Colletotrichum sublineola]